MSTKLQGIKFHLKNTSNIIQPKSVGAAFTAYLFHI